MKKSKEVMTYKNFQIASAVFKIEGTSPLIIHRFSEKSKKQILDKHTKKSKGVKEIRNPEQEYLDALYFLKDGKRTGFPAGGFKAAMIRAGKQLDYVMADLKGWIFIEPDEKETNLVEIIGEHHMREDYVRISNTSADVRFRPEFPEWNAALKINYNSSRISVEQVAEILALAGFSCGIGDWRPEKSATGTFGTWKLI